MPSFRYIAVNGSGQRVSGTLNAPDQRSVLAELERQRLTPVELSEQRLSLGSGPAGVIGSASAGADRRPVRVPIARLASAYGQIGDLLKAGVPLLRSLRVIANRRSAPGLAAVFKELADAVETGDELAASMARRPETFRPVHIAMVRAGEKGGFLEQALHRLSRFLEGQVELRQKVVGNLIYPVAIMVFGVVLLLAVLVFFVPRFQAMFADLELNALTRVVFALSTAVTAYGLLAAIAAGAAAAGLFVLLRRQSVRDRLSDFALGLPVAGPLLRALAIARFCRILGTLLASGVPVLGALAIAKDAAGSQRLSAGIADAAEAVRAGQPLSVPLGKTGLFPDDVLEMVSVAEAANNLEGVLTTIADTLEARVDRLLTNTIRLIEPAMLLILGLSIALVALALILPMLQLTGGIRVS
ncbi:MAG: type II secretion system F family protein [Phycisphaerales bacterium]|nr:type II secretion system F family protein [Phycisphaerales bacterium]